MRDLFFSFYRKIVDKGLRTSFWEDLWMGDKLFCMSFPRLYNPSLGKKVSVARVFSKDGDCLILERTCGVI